MHNNPIWQVKLEHVFEVNIKNMQRAQNKRGSANEPRDQLTDKHEKMQPVQSPQVLKQAFTTP